jgi:hypothetical protein
MGVLLLPSPSVLASEGDTTAARVRRAPRAGVRFMGRRATAGFEIFNLLNNSDVFELQRHLDTGQPRDATGRSERSTFLLGPFVPAWISDHVWRSELMIGVSLALSAAMAATLMLLAFLFTCRPYRTDSAAMT